MALDKKTGSETWRIERDEQSNWSTPYVWRNKLRTELVAGGGGACDPTTLKPGSCFGRWPGSGRTSTTPVGDEELLYVDSYDRLTGGSGVLAAIRLAPRGRFAAGERTGRCA